MNDRIGQVWEGPCLYSPINAHRVLLLVKPIPEMGREAYVALNLESGRLEDFFTRFIDEDSNWKRIT